jgi:hypothetical protein
LNWSSDVTRLASAIKVAEGSNPAWNNPGDLDFADGYPTNGFANSEGVLKFCNAEDGWNALAHQAYLMLSGRSEEYSLNMTITEFGLKYSNGDPNWGKNVAEYYGVPESTTLAELAQLPPKTS